jgi:hypothetical protein
MRPRLLSFTYRYLAISLTLLTAACGLGVLAIVLDHLAGLPPGLKVTVSNMLPFTQIPSSDEGWLAELDFGKQMALDKHWRATSAEAHVQLETTGEEIGKAVPTDLHRDTWGDVIRYDPNLKEHDTVIPYLYVSISVPPSTAHNWIKVSAVMTIVHPVGGYRHSFQNDEDTIRATSRLFVVVPYEFQLMRLSRMFTVIGVLLGLAAFVVFGVHLVSMERARQK